ncbi:hypothetical protein Q8A67_009340 [Cirrhinus molitorella]|uniref:Uncharacterized protein n=1 Tax=Cirrhinus molitorella TaxID=172907 RepID=A0AA88Q6F8_9TELE|nr:hypothetical protein Q8A67_009340 [Cirrhinus molitorella]
MTKRMSSSRLQKFPSSGRRHHSWGKNDRGEISNGIDSGRFITTTHVIGVMLLSHTSSGAAGASNTQAAACILRCTSVKAGRQLPSGLD